MDAPNDTLFRFSVAAVFLSLVAAGPAQAACEWSDRIHVDYAECLDGEWENRNWPWKDTAWVKSECATFGTVVAKVERIGASDWTKWLDSFSKVHMSGTAGDIGGIYCCSDLSDLCNVRDMVNEEGCVTAFKESPASEEPTTNILRERRSCHDASATGDPDTQSCSLDVSCSFWKEVRDNKLRYVTEPRQITVPFGDVYKLVLSIDGQLSVGGD